MKKKNESPGRIEPMVMACSAAIEALFLSTLENLFKAQYGDLPCGGFLNPTQEHDDGDTIIFRCFYDNFDNEDDSWHYGYSRKDGKFFPA